MSESHLSRVPRLGADVFIARGAIVLGDVELGDRASVWYQAVLRGDTARIEIGPETNLQDGVIVHADEGVPCTVGRGVTVGHRAILHGCTVEDGAMIGMGAIVLNGARVGRGALVGAGALVLEGAEIPAGALVLGVPARRVRELSPEEIARHQQAAPHYVAQAAAHRAAGWGA
jgi:carbonic anhydrase/acetyltransferase-like protein (isoleucine patch superfamily)